MAGTEAGVRGKSVAQLVAVVSRQDHVSVTILFLNLAEKTVPLVDWVRLFNPKHAIIFLAKVGVKTIQFFQQLRCRFSNQFLLLELY